MAIPPPNVVFVTCDQLRADALGAYREGKSWTPNIDALARHGTTFDNAYVCSPVCAPNRASWATGMYPSAHGLTTNGIALNPALPSFMECLRRGGYQTAAAGKLHFKPQWSHVRGDPDFAQDTATGKGAADPQPRPWELPYYGLEKCALTEDHNAGPYGDYLLSHGFDPWKDPHSATFPQHVTQRSDVPAEHSKTTWITDQSIEYLNGFDPDRPFLLWTSFVHPHHPFVVPEPYDTMIDPGEMQDPVWAEHVVANWPESYRKKYFAEGTSHEAIGMHLLGNGDFRRIRAYYFGMVAQIDEQVGRLVRELDALQTERETVIIFSSDHGEMLGDQHLLFKATHYRCVTRVPLVVSGRGSHGQRAGGFASAVDIMPTLLGLAGVPTPPGLQGQSLLPCLDDPGHRLRDGAYVENPDLVRSYITADARLTWHGPGTQGELYDAREDPDELHNLWADPSASDLKSRMTEKLLSALVSEAAIPRERVAHF